MLLGTVIRGVLYHCKTGNSVSILFLLMSAGTAATVWWFEEGHFDQVLHTTWVTNVTFFPGIAQLHSSMYMPRPPWILISRLLWMMFCKPSWMMLSGSSCLMFLSLVHGTHYASQMHSKCGIQSLEYKGVYSSLLEHLSTCPLVSFQFYCLKITDGWRDLKGKADKRALERQWTKDT